MDKIEHRLYQVISTQLNIDLKKISPFSRIDDTLGGDSLDGVELVMAIEEEFKFEISDQDANRLVHATVEEISTFLKNGITNEHNDSVQSNHSYRNFNRQLRAILHGNFLSTYFRKFGLSLQAIEEIITESIGIERIQYFSTIPEKEHCDNKIGVGAHIFFLTAKDLFYMNLQNGDVNFRLFNINDISVHCQQVFDTDQKIVSLTLSWIARDFFKSADNKDDRENHLHFFKSFKFETPDEIKRAKSFLKKFHSLHRNLNR